MHPEQISELRKELEGLRQLTVTEASLEETTVTLDGVIEVLIEFMDILEASIAKKNIRQLERAPSITGPTLPLINSRKRLLLYLEECAYQTGGVYRTDDLGPIALDLLQQWISSGFIQSKPIRRGSNLRYGGNRVQMSLEAVDEAYSHRKKLIASRWEKHSRNDGE